MSAFSKRSIAFLVIALNAALFGFGGIASGAEDVAKALCFVFLAVFALTFILGLILFKTLI